MSGNDGFWARVRAALGRGEHAAEPAYGQAEISRPNKKARPAQRIEDELRRGWTESAQRHVSLCVLAMEMDGHGEYFAAYGREAVDDCLDQLEAAIAALLPRASDKCLRSSKAGFVLILPDMPVLMARELASRIAATIRREGVPHRASHAGHVTMSMGLSVVNPEGGLDRAAFNAATEAVKKAQRRGIARLEAVDLRSTGDRRKQAA